MESFWKVASEYMVLAEQWWHSQARSDIVSFRNPLDIWEENPSFLLCELVFLTWGLISFRHASQHGGRYWWLWVAALIHGLVTESVSYFVPDVDNFWHTRSMIMFMKHRLPLHIALFYPSLLYTEIQCVSRLKLSPLVEPFVVGLLDVVIDAPFDVMGIKLIWWTWHESDPNIYDRTFFVPWTSYIFHMTFASSFVILHHLTRYLLIGNYRLDHLSNSTFVEFVCVILTSVFTFPLAVVTQFIPLYHFLHDLRGVHTEVVVFILIGVYILIAWIGDRHREVEVKPAVKGRSRRAWFDGLAMMLTIHFVFYIFLLWMASPQHIRSTGPHQAITYNCDHMRQESIQTIGIELHRNASICFSNHREEYYDLNCSVLELSNQKLPSEGDTWYTICGTAYPNKAEYIVVVTGLSLLGLVIFHQLLSTAPLPRKIKKQ